MSFLKEGDIFRLEYGHRVYYSNTIGIFDKLYKTVVTVGNNDPFDFEFLVGKYVVTKTALDGGGTGHGPFDIYPDGHHVWAQNINFPHIKVDFYQSGSFTAVNEEIKSIGRAKLTWEVESNE